MRSSIVPNEKLTFVLPKSSARGYMCFTNLTKCKQTGCLFFLEDEH